MRISHVAVTMMLATGCSAPAAPAASPPATPSIEPVRIVAPAEPPPSSAPQVAPATPNCPVNTELQAGACVPKPLPPPPPLGPPGPADQAAEKEYDKLDKLIASTFDFDTGHQRYSGQAVDVIKTFRDNKTKAQTFHTQLGDILTANPSRRWAPVLKARQASLYDSLRTGLLETKPPALKLFTDGEAKVLKKFDAAGSQEDQARAQEYRAKRLELWTQVRDNEMLPLDQAAVHSYAEAIVGAEQIGLSHPAIERARKRLAVLAEGTTEQRLADWVKDVVGLVYKPGLFKNPAASYTGR